MASVTTSAKTTGPQKDAAEPAANGTHRLPPLEAGDSLSRDEFERRYEATPELKMAELIEGAVIVPSPVRHVAHGRPHAALVWWLTTFQVATPGVSVGDNSSVRIDLENVLQPDALVIVDPARGGQARIDDEGYIAGSPELVCEISATTASIDLNAKLRVYRRNQVREYLVWRVFDRALDWFVLRNSEFSRVEPGADGLLRSEVFPGLWLDAEALMAGDLAKVGQKLQEGIASPEHAAFVAKLAAPQAG